MTNTEQEMKLSQTYRAASIATRTIRDPRLAMDQLPHRAPDRDRAV